MRFVYDNFRNKPFKPLYNALVPKSYRKKWHYNYSEIPTQMHVAEFWQDAIAKYQKGELARYDLPVKRPELVGKKIIWQYWAQGMDNLPELAKICFHSVDCFKGEYTVIRLSDKDIANYLGFPEFIVEKRLNSEFRPVFFSDLLRVALINNYGGIWLDASVLMTAQLPEDLIQLPFFMYSREDHSENKDWGLVADHLYFNWDTNFKVKFLSSIVFGKPKTALSQTLQDLLIYYWQTQNSIEHYFFFQILINELKQTNAVAFDFPVVDDTYPHLLQFDLNKPFDKVRYDYIIQKSSLHKLSFHKKSNDSNNQTFYHYIKHQFLNGY